MKLNKQRQVWAHMESVGIKALQVMKDGQHEEVKGMTRRKERPC